MDSVAFRSGCTNGIFLAEYKGLKSINVTVQKSKYTWGKQNLLAYFSLHLAVYWSDVILFVDFVY